MHLRGLRWRHRDDRGVAMITAIMVLTVLGAISATVAVIGVSNIKNSDRDRQAGAALGASDAGVAQAIEYVRNNGVNGLTCPEITSASCSTNPAGWTNPTNPKLVPLGSGGACTATNCAKVWIGNVRAYAPPTVTTGTYRIHSEGIYGGGPAARNVVVDIEVTPDRFPIGVFGEQVSGNGGTAVYSESLFTRACVSPLETGSGNGTRFIGTDPYWGIPSAAHSTTHLSTSNNCGANGYVHKPAQLCPTNSVLQDDQSGDGGAVSSGPCYQRYRRPDGSWYNTTAFTLNDLQQYGYRPRGLSDAQLSALRVRAQSQGLYNVSSGSIAAKIVAANAAGISQPVVYYDSVPNVALSYSDFPAGYFGRAPGEPCNNSIVTLVVEHGNLTFQGGNATWFDAAIFVPDGAFNGNGGYNILGTLFADNLGLGGNQTFELDDCFVKSLPGPILAIHATAFREDDSKDVP